METTISSQSRNLGIGWSNTPVQTERGLVISVPTSPDSTGNVTECEKTIARAYHLNKGNDWTYALFVGGQRVEAIWGLHLTYPVDYEERLDDARHLSRITAGREGSFPEPEARWTWLTPTRDMISETLSRLREGETVRVRLAAAPTLPSYTCQRCGWEWYPRRPERPVRCANPKCRSPYWDKARDGGA